MRSVQYARSRHGRALHPTEKPLAILAPLVRYSIQRDGWIFDPFAGSGSVLLAARMNGRNAVGIEANERYCEIAATRLSSELAFVGGGS